MNTKWPDGPFCILLDMFIMLPETVILSKTITEVDLNNALTSSPVISSSRFTEPVVITTHISYPPTSFNNSEVSRLRMQLLNGKLIFLDIKCCFFIDLNSAVNYHLIMLCLFMLVLI